LGVLINGGRALPELINTITAACSMVAAMATLLLAIRRGRDD
jgi:hypothetical protein